MIRKAIMVGCLLCALSLSACYGPFSIRRITASGNVVSQEYDISGFDQVEVCCGFRADISAGDSFEVVAEVDDNLLGEVEVVKMGSTLRIGLKPNVGYSLVNATLSATVTMPKLAGVESSGGSHVTVSGFRSSEYLSVEVSGGAEVRGDIEAGDTEFDCSGGGRVDLSGSAADLQLNASGGALVEMGEFTVENASIEASGGAEVTVGVSGTLDAEATGGARVFYVGSPTLGDIESSGGGSVGPR